MFNPNAVFPTRAGNPEMLEVLARLDLLERGFQTHLRGTQELVRLIHQQAQELQSLRSLITKALSSKPKPKLPFWRRWFMRKVTQQ